MDNNRNNISNNTYRKMQELLPDYIFNRISPQDKLFFESNITAYPDLAEEVDSTRRVFSKLENMDFNAHIQDRTRYMSYNVLNRMQKSRPRPMGRAAFMYRFAIPALGLAIAAFIFMNNYDFKGVNGTLAGKSAVSSTRTAAVSNSYSILSLSDLASIKDASAGEDISRLTSILTFEGSSDRLSDELSRDNSPIENIMNNYVAENLVKIIKHKSYPTTSSMPGAENDLFDQMSKLNEDEFQNILEALENAKISV